MCSWPSGLRRCIKAAVSSEAWVRIPSNTISFCILKIFLMFLFSFLTLSNDVTNININTHVCQRKIFNCPYFCCLGSWLLANVFYIFLIAFYLFPSPKTWVKTNGVSSIWSLTMVVSDSITLCTLKHLSGSRRISSSSGNIEYG